MSQHARIRRVMAHGGNDEHETVVVARVGETEIEKDTNFHDFRKNPRVMMKSSMKAGIKRLQEGPRNTKKKDDQRSLAGKTLIKLIDRLTSEIPEVMIGEETKRKQRLELKIKKKEP